MKQASDSAPLFYDVKTQIEHDKTSKTYGMHPNLDHGISLHKGYIIFSLTSSFFVTNLAQASHKPVEVTTFDTYKTEKAHAHTYFISP